MDKSLAATAATVGTVPTCRVWWATAGWGAGLTELLTPEERSRATAFRRHEDRDRFVTGSVLLRLVLAEEMGIAPEAVPVVRSCATCGRPHGKPRLLDHPWQLSLSHSGDRVGLAVSDSPAVGIDVEAVDAVGAAAAEELVDRLLTSSEIALLAEVPTTLRATAVLRSWVRKEAVLKALGSGLETPLTSFEVGSALRGPVLAGVVGGITARDLVVVDLAPGRGHVASLAAVGRIGAVDELQLEGVASAH